MPTRLALVAVLLATVAAPAADPPRVVRENIEWLDVWVPENNTPGLPRVLLVGDSITRSYYPEVEKRLKGKAAVSRLTTSKSVGDPGLLAEVALVLGATKFDVVHFNNGLHGWDYTEAEYAKALPEFVAAIRKGASGAKLVWATTTPVRVTDKVDQLDAKTDRVTARNKIAADLMAKEHIPTDDLFALAADKAEWYSRDGVHFNAKGTTAFGEQVAKHVRDALGGAKPAAVGHSFLATGGETFIVDAAGKTTWSYPQSSRDGWVLPNGNVLLALSQGKDAPGGSAAEVTRDGKVVFAFKGTQSEVNTVQPLDNGNVLLTEAGPKPRLLEVTRDGKVAVEVPLQAQTKDHHLQTRMARKLANGNYLVPQLLDRVVREYTPTGKVVWEVKTPHMPFTAIRLPDGHTLIGCTLGNLVIEVDATGNEVWRLTNDDLPGRPINDACGVQRLPNGNTVVTSHHNTAKQPKLTEVTRDKKVVWTYTDDRRSGIHHFEILDADGKPLPGKPLK